MLFGGVGVVVDVVDVSSGSVDGDDSCGRRLKGRGERSEREAGLAGDDERGSGRNGLKVCHA